MKRPVATYRIQFREGMTFEHASRRLAYLKSLGISHVYASPIFKATAGSTHGYDITDMNEIDPAIGGQEGFDRFCRALKTFDLGLILDIVPNHMAASLENAWWRDVLENGAASVFARYFDIDWSERLTLPHLGKPFDSAVADGELRIAVDASGSPTFQYLETRYPLSPESAASLLTETGGSHDALAALSQSPGRMADLHDQQHWQLIHWTEAAHHLSYRRFFEVTGLVGLRVEDCHVFNDSHRLILDLVKRGDVDGLRIDHIDGLADPAGYLDNLRALVGDDIPVYVEKILGHGEQIRPEWSTEGTTGYEFVEAVSNVFLDRKGVDVLDTHYRQVAPELDDFPVELMRAKTLMATVNFKAEMSRLVEIAESLLPDVDPSQIESAIRALLIAFPVYRTYATGDGMSRIDDAVLRRVITEAREKESGNPAFDPVAALLHTNAPAVLKQTELMVRFQQLTGPIMAKSMEDTLFYRFNRFLAANEVGGEPDVPAGDVAVFHEAMSLRLDTQPFGLSATSTHDTKRGEDARARLYAISEAPDLWSSHVARWRAMNAPFLETLATGPAPEPNIEWMLYQALLGVWPADIEAFDIPSLKDRFSAYALKAVREAKLRTNWSSPDQDYEAAVEGYARGLVDDGNVAFLADFASVCEPFILAGFINSLTQTLLKMTAPGIPDIYQGAEGFDFSLVDPDNRRTVDYERLAALPDAPGTASGFEQMKMNIVRQGLRLRQERPQLFLQGDYLPLTIMGKRRDNVIAFARRHKDDYAVVVAPRLVFGAVNAGQRTIDASFWEDTVLDLPAGLAGPKRDVIAFTKSLPADRVALSDILIHPVALLVRE